MPKKPRVVISPKPKKITKKPLKKPAPVIAPKERYIPQHYPVRVKISYPRGGSLETIIYIDLWGLVLDQDNLKHNALHEMENVVMQKLKVEPLTGELSKLLEAHRLFHNQQKQAP